MIRYLSAALTLILLTSRPAAASPGPVHSLSPEARTAVQKLRTYCKACHGIGEMRFIPPGDDAQVWDHLFSAKAPNSGRIWAEAIRQVLSWPSDSPPPFGSLMAPPDRDWMPKGAKRLRFAEEKVNGVTLRRFILDTLASHWDNGSP